MLLTAAHNERADIEHTIRSVLSQTVLPIKWVIASDNSTDGTDELVQRYACEYDWICFLRISREPGTSFASKVIALQKGEELLRGIPYRYIGVADGDVAFEPFYFQRLMERFDANPRLGIAGGFVHDLIDGTFLNRPGNTSQSVSHAGQLVRRECFESFGGYAVLKYGGEDWHALISAQMKGWLGEAFPDLKIFHYRPTGTKNNHLRHVFRQGRMDYSLGSYFPFEILKCATRIPASPFFVGGVARLVGFCWSSIIREERPVTKEFIKFLREGQKRRVRELITGAKNSRNAAQV